MYYIGIKCVLVSIILQLILLGKLCGNSSFTLMAKLFTGSVFVVELYLDTK